MSGPHRHRNSLQNRQLDPSFPLLSDPSALQGHRLFQQRHRWSCSSLLHKIDRPQQSRWFLATNHHVTICSKVELSLPLENACQMPADDYRTRQAQTEPVMNTGMDRRSGS